MIIATARPSLIDRSRFNSCYRGARIDPDSLLSFNDTLRPHHQPAATLVLAFYARKT
jgi:hypothetical protein